MYWRAKITIPSYPVSRDEEESIQYHPSSGLNNPEHAIRKAIDGRREKAEYAVDEVDPEATAEFAAEVQAAAEAAPTVESGGDVSDDTQSNSQHLQFLQ